MTMFALLQVIIKEFLQLRYDRKMIPVLVVGPLVQLLALGYAANLDVNLVPTLLVDQDRTPESRRLVEAFTASGYFRIVGEADTTAAVESWLVDNRARVALVVGAGYGEAVAAGRRPALQLIADGTDSNSAVVGMGYASSLVAGQNRELVERAITRESQLASDAGRAFAARPGSVVMVSRVFYNPDLRSRWFYVPAVLAMVLMLVTMMLPSMAVVREKEIGTLEQISVTPLRPWQLIVGKLVPFAIIGLIDTAIVTGLAMIVFGVPLRGSFVLLLGLTLLYLLNMLGLGLLVSTIVRTQQQAMMASAFMLMVPMIYLSGLIFPIENMPKIFQWISTIIPVRYYGNVVRGVFLRGSGIEVLWIDGLAMAAIATFVLILASLRFRKSLD
jgi:ABC-2 type transport system permease protein